MREAVIDHIRTLSQAHTELAESLPDEAFDRKLIARSNAIGEQFWCVIGARESYANAIANDGWAGFSCSLPGSATGDKEQVVRALGQSELKFERVSDEVEWTEVRDELLLALLEHEAQHQGQLIRYVYGLEYPFPESWAHRWTLTQQSG